MKARNVSRIAANSDPEWMKGKVGMSICCCPLNGSNTLDPLKIFPSQALPLVELITVVAGKKKFAGVEVAGLGRWEMADQWKQFMRRGWASVQSPPQPFYLPILQVIALQFPPYNPTATHARSRSFSWPSFFDRICPSKANHSKFGKEADKPFSNSCWQWVPLVKKVSNGWTIRFQEVRF